MVRRYNRLLVAFYVVTDALLGDGRVRRSPTCSASRLPRRPDPDHQGHAAVRAVPGIAAVHRRCSCRSRSSSRASTACAAAARASTTSSRVLVGSILAVVLGVVGTLYFQAYYVAGRAQGRRASTKSRSWSGCSSSSLNVVVRLRVARVRARSARAALARRHRPEARADCRRRRSRAAWSPTGSSSTASSASRSSASSTIAPAAITSATAACRCSARSARPPRSSGASSIDHLYVALPLEEHVKMLDLVEATSREGVDVKVVPDLLQFIALRARLEDLDGVPVISLNDVPLQGFNSVLKRALDVAHLGGGAGRAGASRSRSSPLLIKRTSPGPVFYTQERMGLDGKAFTVYKFRSMSDGRRGRDRPGLGARRRPARDAGRPLAAPLRPRRAAAVLERAAAATCRSSARGPSGRLRRAVQAPHPAVHAAPQGQGRASPAGRRSTAGAATPRSRSASSTTSTTSRTGRSPSTSRSCGSRCVRGLQQHAY